MFALQRRWQPLDEVAREQWHGVGDRNGGSIAGRQTTLNQHVEVDRAFH